jgi:myo-inositol 2-dehydrogenase/D-chiro-inositol 1-dehydrogenase
MGNKSGTLNIGIIGCGGVTETFHLPSLKSIDNVQVLALSDVDKKKLDRVADTFEIRNRYEDPYELINRPEIEAVAVCAPSEHHFALGMAALGAGKHLFIEKPVALSLGESGQLIKKAGESSVKAFAGFNQRFHRSVRKAKEIIGNGRLGRVRTARSAMTADQPGIAEWRKKRSLGGGAIMDLAIHHFDLLRYLFGSEAEEVRAGSLSGEIEDEEATATIKMSNGILASSVFSYRSGDRNEIEVHGDDGILRISLYDAGGFGIRANSDAAGGLISMIGRQFQRIVQAAANADALKYGGVFKESYYNEWHSFAESVIHNKEIECNLDDGERALEIALAAVEAASAGIPVRLPSPPGELG